jgi:hypothetical protein
MRHDVDHERSFGSPLRAPRALATQTPIGLSASRGTALVLIVATALAYASQDSVVHAGCAADGLTCDPNNPPPKKKDPATPTKETQKSAKGEKK